MERYEYFEWLTFVCLIRGLLVNIGRVKEEGSEARNVLEGYERESTGSLVITGRTNQAWLMSKVINTGPL
jgi:hypothetical protein